MRRFAGYPRYFYPLLVLAFVALGASGVLLLPHMLTMRMDWDAPFQVAGDVRLASAAVHCAVAFVAVFLLGELASLHIRSGWRRRRNLASGATLVALFVSLCLSAVGVYYFGDENLSRWSSMIHSAAGLLLVVVVLWHGVGGHFIYNRRHNRRSLRRPCPRHADYRADASVRDLLRGGQAQAAMPE